MAGASAGRSLEQTPTWAVAVVCFVLVGISIVIEYIIHLIGKFFKTRNKRALYEALEKVKSELMLLGFISLLLTIGQDPISNICIPESVAATWHPCTRSRELKKYPPKEDIPEENRRKLLFSNGSAAVFRRRLAAAGTDPCIDKGKVAFISADGIHQLHIFIFVLAVFHIIYSILTMAFGTAKMRKWKAWEKETKTAEYQFSHDPERFRFARETSFGRRHLSFWSRTPILMWIVCFFRQFVRSVPKVDYLTLRHGFIMAHLAPQSHTQFDFQKYIKRSLDEDFKTVVGISPPIWFFAFVFLLFNTHGWYAYLWLPFIPLIIILVVGTKLQVIITKMGLRIQERGEVVKGLPVVEPGDELFWFNRPQLILHLINFVLFQNAFQLALFVWSWYEFGLRSCFHEQVEDIVIRISMGILIQILCSYVTLPLYALVTQMGSTMKPTIFNERVAAALRNWHHTAKKNLKQSKHSSYPATPSTSRPATPSHRMSPVHLLRRYRSEIGSRQKPVYDADNWESDGGSPSLSPTRFHQNREPDEESLSFHQKHAEPDQIEEESELASAEVAPPPTPILPAVEAPREEHEIVVGMPKDFSFDKRTGT